MFKSIFIVISLITSSHAFSVDQVEEVNVTSTRISSSLEEVPASVGLINEEMIKDSQAHSLSDLFSLIPNVSADLTPRSSGQKITIRGLDSSRLLILVDGARQNFRNSHNSGLFVNTDLLKKVEVMKGPASSLYGSGAIGGVVSFVTKDASDFLKNGEKFGGIVEAGYHSATDKRKERITLFTETGTIGLVTSLGIDESHNLELGDDTRLDDSAADNKDLFIKIGSVSGRKHYYQISYETIKTKTEEPNNPDDQVTSRNGLVKNESKRSSVTARYHLNQKSNKLLDPYLTLYHVETDVDKTPVSTSVLEQRETQTYGLDLYNNAKIFRSTHTNHLLSFGIETFKDTNRGRKNGEGLSSFPDGKGTSLGLYTQYQISLFNKIRVIPGLRYDSYKITARDESFKVNEDSELTKKLAINADINDNFTLFANYGEGFNAPRMQDLFISGQHFPGNFFSSNPDLKAEKTKTFEVGFKAAFADLIQEEDSPFMEFTVFQTKARDFVVREVDMVNGTTQFINEDKVELIGGEFTLGYETNSLLTSLSYSQTRSKNEITNQSLDSTPADEWTFNTRYNFNSYNLKTGYKLTVAEDQNRVSGSGHSPVPATKGYVTHDFFLSWDAKRVLKGTIISFRINNAFDKAYRKHEGKILSAGRDMRLNVKYRF